MTLGSDLLVVLPCLNERTHLPSVLASICADPSTAGAILVIADGGSTDGTRELAQAQAELDGRIVLLDNPQRRQSAGVNLAVRHFGKGRTWLLRVDVHGAYPPNFVTRLTAEAAATGATSVVIPMRTVGFEWFQQAAAAAQNSHLGAGGAAHRRPGQSHWVDHGHHALISLAAFTRAGGYDESFLANEDAELDHRFIKSGARIWLAGDIVMDYFPRRTPSALFRQYVRHGAGRAQTLVRHRIRPKLRQLLPSLVVPALLALAAAPLWPPAAALAGAWVGACLCYGMFLAAKWRNPRLILSGPAAMIMHLAWSLGFWRFVLLSGLSGALQPTSRAITGLGCVPPGTAEEADV